MVMRIQVDRGAFERVVQSRGDDMKAISERAQAKGAIRHAFFAGDGEVLIVDEWDQPESFLAFFEEEGPNIGPLMAESGAQPGQPQFYEKLEGPDVF